MLLTSYCNHVERANSSTKEDFYLRFDGHGFSVRAEHPSLGDPHADYEQMYSLFRCESEIAPRQGQGYCL